MPRLHSPNCRVGWSLSRRAAMHNSLSCSACGLDHAIDRLQNLCTDCGKPLLVGYDLEGLRDTFTPEVVGARSERSMWRFAEVLPVDDPGESI